MTAAWTDEWAARDRALGLVLGLLRGSVSAVTVEIRPGWRTFDADREYLVLRVEHQRGEDPDADDPPPATEVHVPRAELLERLRALVTA